MRPGMTRLTDEEQVRSIIASQLKALSEKDTAGAIRSYSKGSVMYTMAPPLRSQNDDEESATEAVDQWFDTWDTPPQYETRDLEITVSGDLAYSTGLFHMTGDQQGKRVDQWYRRTMVFERTPDGWRIAHDHESVPFYLDGSFKAAVDLKP